MLTVLIVEDDEPIHAGLRVLLTEEGYATLDAWNGQQALEYIRSTPRPLIVLLDWRLPDMDGGHVFQTAHAEPTPERRRAYIFCTANSDTLPLATVRLMDQLRVPLVRKPFDIDDLLAAIARAGDSLEM